MKAQRYLATLLLAGVVASAPACAASVYGTSRSGGYSTGYYLQFQRHAYDNGYRQGRDHGRDDWRRQRSFNYSRSREYRNANYGFRNDGDRGVYRDYFRRGFEAGYSEQFNGRRR